MYLQSRPSKGHFCSNSEKFWTSAIYADFQIYVFWTLKCYDFAHFKARGMLCFANYHIPDIFLPSYDCKYLTMVVKNKKNDKTQKLNFWAFSNEILNISTQKRHSRGILFAYENMLQSLILQPFGSKNLIIREKVSLLYADFVWSR